MNDKEKANFRRWLEQWDALAISAAPWNRPNYAKRRILRRIEPFATEYDQLHRQHPEYYASEDGPPDPKWYAPTPKLLDLEARLDELRAKGFEEIDNPDYDPERAAAWEAKWVRRPFDQTKVEWGQSYTATVEGR